MKPTQEQITAEIAKLKDLAPRIRQHDAFGGNNRAKIDAEIRVLEKNMTHDQIDEHWDGMSHHERDVNWDAHEARDWMDGESEEESLAAGWEGLARG